MGHVNPAVYQPKDSWRWQTSNSEYGKFYVRENQREVLSQEAQNECFKKCEELTHELQEAKAQLEKLELSRDRHICGPAGECVAVRLHDTACQTSPTSPKRDWTIATKPGQPNRKMYKTEKKNNYNGLEGHDSHQMLLDHEKEDNAHRVERERQKLPLLSLRNGRNNEYLLTGETAMDRGDGNGQDNGDMENCRTKMPSGCGLHCLMSRSASRNSSSSISAKDLEQVSPCKRKILQKHRVGAPKKRKGSIIKAASDLKHIAGSGANLSPTQRYNFYRNFGYGGQGAKTSKGWHSLKNPWMSS